MKFIILAKQRSGTTLLTNYLNSHPELRCYQEFYFMENEVLQAYLGGDYDKREDYFKLFQSLPENNGFNLKYNQISDQKLDRYREKKMKPEIKFIHLIRLNIFEHAISSWINDHKGISGRLHALSKENKDKFDYSKKFKISVKVLNRIMKEIYEDTNKWYLKLKDDENTLILFYEDIIDLNQKDWTSEMPEESSKKVCDFLKVEDRPLTAQLKKVNSPNYGDYILNWREIKELKDVYKYNFI